MTFNGRTATTVVMLAIFAAACLLALDLPKKAAFMPLLIGIPGTILCAWQLVLDLRRAPEAPKSDDGNDEGQSEVGVFLWLAAFSVSIVGFGFVIGGPVIVFAFVRFASKEPKAVALSAAAGTFLVVWGVFIWLLELPLFQGLVLEAVL